MRFTIKEFMVLFCLYQRLNFLYRIASRVYLSLPLPLRFLKSSTVLHACGRDEKIECGVGQNLLCARKNDEIEWGRGGG
jgi:hypothetical protein